MISDKLPVCVILLYLVPGVLCKYDFDVGGIVAASVMGFFMLVLITILLIVIVMWRDWYERKQILKGRQKRPRRYWGFFPAKSKSPSILLSTPRSDRKPYVVGQRVIRDSRNTTLTRADEWLTKLPPHHAEFAQPQPRYEEKVQTMNFEPEEEAVIVAELLPDSGHRATQRTTQTTTRDYQNVPPKVEYPNIDGGENTVYITYNPPKSNYETRQQFRHTIATEPYHVKLGQLGESRKSEDLYIAQPETPTTSHIPGYTVQSQQPEETPGPSGVNVIVNNDTDQPAVMTFQDSDEEAGMIPTVQPRGEGDVLF